MKVLNNCFLRFLPPPIENTLLNRKTFLLISSVSSLVKKSNFVGDYTKDQEEPVQNKLFTPKDNYKSRRENIMKKDFPLPQEEKIKDQGEDSLTKSSKIRVKSSIGKMFEFTESEVR